MDNYDLLQATKHYIELAYRHEENFIKEFLPNNHNVFEVNGIYFGGSIVYIKYLADVGWLEPKQTTINTLDFLYWCDNIGGKYEG